MTKIAFIGAGSLGFTRNLVRDILTFPLLQDTTFSLMDIDPERLGFAQKSVELLIERSGCPARVQASLKRAEALEGADVVLCTILVGDTSVWRHDIEIPKKYGIRQTIADTLGIGGIMRGLRTIPVFLDICKDMEELCPDVMFLQYVNPMAMNTWAINRASKIKTVGLCHSVQGTAEALAEDLALFLSHQQLAVTSFDIAKIVREVVEEKRAQDDH